MNTYEKMATRPTSAPDFVDKGRLARALHRLETFGTESPDRLMAPDKAVRPGVLTIEAGAWTITATVMACPRRRSDGTGTTSSVPAGSFPLEPGAATCNASD